MGGQDREWVQGKEQQEKVLGKAQTGNCLMWGWRRGWVQGKVLTRHCP